MVPFVRKTDISEGLCGRNEWHGACVSSPFIPQETRPMKLASTRRHVLAALLAASLPALALAQGKEIRIAHVYSKPGPLEAYGKQTQTGLMMGLDYATQGTMTVAGKKIVVIEKDDQGKPDVGKSLLAAAYGDDKADIALGPSSSGVALALLPVAEEYKKILLVQPAGADSIP